MRKILILTLSILLFAHPSAQARKNMKIRTGQARTDSEKAQADSGKARTDSGQTRIDSEQARTDSRQARTDSEKARTDSEKAQTDSEKARTNPEKAQTDPEKAQADSGKARTDDVKPEEKEISAFDYEAMALLSVDLNPNENPDEVISLLEPYKDSENNQSFIFYSSLGLAYKNKGRFKEAITAYVRSLELEPNEPAVQYYLGIAYYKNNELPEALRYFLKSSEQNPDHPGAKKWIDKLTKELDICKVPDISSLKMVFDNNINVNRQKPDRESRLRIYTTQDGGQIQVLSVNDKIYSYGIDSDTKKPVDYIIIDTDGDGMFEKVINTKGKFGVPAWAYNPE